LALAACVLAGVSLARAPATGAAIVRGGGARRTDCLVVFDAPGAAAPGATGEPRRIDCIDGDPRCDADGERNGRCVFDLRLCLNSTAVSGCSPGAVDAVVVAHAEDDGDPRFDPDFQALQLRIDLLELPENTDRDACTFVSAVTVPLAGPAAANTMRPARKRLVVSAAGTAGGRATHDRDALRAGCRPEGDRVYVPRDLYTGTFDRIAQQIFAPRCALSACHDSESFQNDLELLPGSAYAQIVGVVPFNVGAAAAALLRVTPGDPERSYLFRKITFDLEPGWGGGMPLAGPPLSPALVDLLEAWIVGDGVLGPAPATGWVEGTDG
jgi:hypothetical protein